MRQCHVTTERSNWKAQVVLASFALLFSPFVFAAVERLPNLPGSDVPAPLQWRLDEQGASLAYTTRFEKWEAKIDAGDDSAAAVVFDYGLLLTSRLGAGTTFRLEDDYSEIVANAVYAHRRNVRFRVASAQLRTTGSGVRSYGDALSFRQDSYLFSARKFWPAERFVSDLGLVFYTIDATPSVPVLMSPLESAESLEADEDRPSSVLAGKMDGFLLNLGFRPTWLSRIDLRREFSHVDYRQHVGTMRSEFLSTGRISYSRQLDNCLHFRGGYSMGGEAGRLDLGLGKDNWSVNLSQDFNDTAAGTVLHVSFAIPLGGKAVRASSCRTYASTAPSFAPIVDAALQRPPQFPREPIAVVEAE